MAEKNKYYWLKLSKDFFKRHDIKIVESMPNGKDYILFYLKMLLESITHNGELRFNDSIPYNEQMLSVITDTNVDTVKQAIKIFTELNMMQIMDDQTIYMCEVEKMIGSETKSAERVRKYRENQKALQCNTDVTNCNIDKEIDKDLEKDLKKERKEIMCARGKFANVFLTDEEFAKLKDECPISWEKKIDNLSEYLVNNPQKHYASHFDTILKWHKQDTKDTSFNIEKAQLKGLDRTRDIGSKKNPKRKRS